jgi:hypothetical protein
LILRSWTKCWLYTQTSKLRSNRPFAGSADRFTKYGCCCSALCALDESQRSDQRFRSLFPRRSWPICKIPDLAYRTDTDQHDRPESAAWWERVAGKTTSCSGKTKVNNLQWYQCCAIWHHERVGDQPHCSPRGRYSDKDKKATAVRTEQALVVRHV